MMDERTKALEAAARNGGTPWSIASMAYDAAVAAERDRRAKERATLMAAAAMLARMVEGDSVTMAVISEMAEDIGRVLRPNTAVTGLGRERS